MFLSDVPSIRPLGTPPETTTSRQSKALTESHIKEAYRKYRICPYTIYGVPIRLWKTPSAVLYSVFDVGHV